MSRLRPTADVVLPFLVEEFYMTSFFALVSYVISQSFVQINKSDPTNDSNCNCHNSSM